MNRIPAKLANVVSTFNGRNFAPEDEWIAAVFYPDYLGIAFTERLADSPGFIRQVEVLAGVSIRSIRGTAARALPGDPPLLGDCIEHGTFDSDRLARRFALELGGTWSITCMLKDLNDPQCGYDVSIDRAAGTLP